MEDLKVNIDLMTKKVINLSKQYPTREEKINNLENELYSRLQDEETGVYIDDLMSAIELLQNNKIMEDEINLKASTGFIAGFHNYVWTGLLLLCVAIPSSYLASKICGNSQSKMCGFSRFIPDFIDSYTHEPQSKILPVDFKP